MADPKPTFAKFIRITELSSGSFLGITDEGRVFRTYELKTTGTEWEEISRPDTSKVQKVLTKKENNARDRQ